MRVPSVHRFPDPDREMREELLRGEHDVRVQVVQEVEPEAPEDDERPIPFGVTYAGVVVLAIALYGGIALWLGWIVALALGVLAIVLAPVLFWNWSVPDDREN